MVCLVLVVNWSESQQGDWLMLSVENIVGAKHRDPQTVRPCGH